LPVAVREAVAYFGVELAELREPLEPELLEPELWPPLEPLLEPRLEPEELPLL